MILSMLFLVICIIVVLKLTVTLFISQYFDQIALIFVDHWKKLSITKKNYLQRTAISQDYWFCQN